MSIGATPDQGDGVFGDGFVRFLVTRCNHNFGILDSALRRRSQKSYHSATLEFLYFVAKHSVLPRNSFFAFTSIIFTTLKNILSSSQTDVKLKLFCSKQPTSVKFRIFGAIYFVPKTVTS